MLARVFREEPTLASPTASREQVSPRMCIPHHVTGWEDVRETVAAIDRFYRDALAVAQDDTHSARPADTRE